MPVVHHYEIINPAIAPYIVLPHGELVMGQLPLLQPTNR